MSNKDPKIITHAITRMLARREHSRVEIMQKLRAKDYDEKVCLAQLQKFIDNNIQSDTRYIDVYVRSAYNKGNGPNVIKQSLATQEIDEYELSECINQSQFNWFELASQVREKKFGQSLPCDFKDIQKQKRFLLYRGFEHAHIQYAFET